MLNIDGGVIGWVVGLIAALVAFISLKSRNSISNKIKEQEGRINAINEAKKISDKVETLDDDRIIDAFDELHNKRR